MSGLAGTVNGVMSVVRAELYKALRKRRSYLMAGFLWLLIPLLLVFIGWILQTRVAGTFVDEGDALQVGAVIQAIASPAAISANSLLLLGLLSPTLLLIVVALIAALLIGEERAHNMWKTVLTAQPSRPVILAGKLLTAMILLAVLFAGSYVSGPIIGGLATLFLPTSFGTGWLELAGVYGLQWLFATTAMLFAFLMLWLIRSQPLGVVAIFFLPGLIEGAISFYLAVGGLERLNRLNIFFEALRLRNLVESLPQYFFSANLYAPSRQPLRGLAEVFGPEFVSGFSGGPFATFFAGDLSRSALVMAVYGLIFLALLLWSFTKRDVT
jgi:ABC-type transport system involved in multi-copper enzyme maturation permease subunit